MFGLDNFALDRLSFWLGFVAGTLFWILIYRLLKGLPTLRSMIRQQIAANRERRLAGVGAVLRQEVLRRAQRNHLAARMFSLDEVLIIPSLLAPPPTIDPEDPPNIERFSTQVVTYLPECPEFSSYYGAVRLSLEQVVSGNRRTVIVGRAGGGKSTALAYLASIISRGESHNNNLAALFPVYLHILDLEWDTQADKKAIDILTRGISRYAPVTALPQLSKFLQNAYATNYAILLLDGIDELPENQLTSVRAFLDDLTHSHPEMRMVITGSIEYVDGLTALGFEPLAIAGWTPGQVSDFIHRWGKLWNNLIAINSSQQNQIEILDDLLVSGWMTHDPVYLSPMEWTLKTWGAYAGDISGLDASQFIRAYIKRNTKNLIPDSALALIANEFIDHKTAILDYQLLGKRISNVKLTVPLEEIPELSRDEVGVRPPSKDTKQTKTLTSGNQILELLIDGDILTERINDQLSFTSPVLCGYLAALSLPENLGSPGNILSSAESERYRYTLAFHPSAWLGEYLLNDHLLTLQNLFTSCLWMRDISPNNPNRSQIMRQVVQSIQNENIPYGARLRLLAASSTSNDPSLVVLYRQLLSSQTPSLRALAALGCGINQDSRSVKNLSELLYDEYPQVRYAACFALAAIPQTDAKNALLEILHYGDETLRLVAAETLSEKPGYGHEKLKELTESEDLLVRRSAVYGLALISEDWVVEMLEKIAVEDGQWVVRNTAGQALENKQRPNPFIPNQLPLPSESPWLISFASKLGIGVSQEDSPVLLLLQALKSGKDEEKLAAIQMLRNYPEDPVIAELYKHAFDNQPEIRDAAMYALWYFRISGAKPPDLKVG